MQHHTMLKREKREREIYVEDGVNKALHNPVSPEKASANGEVLRFSEKASANGDVLSVLSRKALVLFKHLCNTSIKSLLYAAHTESEATPTVADMRVRGCQRRRRQDAP